jgi:hypothetical protein
MNVAQKREGVNQQYRKLMLSAVLLVTGAFFLAFLLILIFFLNDAEKTGQFGDSFGAVNALFSALAFAFVVISLFIQMRELSESLQQFRDANAAHQSTNDVQRKATLVQAMANHTQLERDSVFHLKEIYPDSHECKRLLRTFDYLFDLELLIAELSNRVGPSLDLYSRQRRLALLLLHYADTMFETSSPSMVYNGKSIEENIRTELEKIVAEAGEGVAFINNNIAGEIVTAIVNGKNSTSGEHSGLAELWEEYQQETAGVIITEAVKQLGFRVK